MPISSAASPKVYWISPSEPFNLSPSVRQKFWPFLLIFAGLALLLVYFWFFRGTSETLNQEQSSNSESFPLDDSRGDSQTTPGARQSLLSQVTQTADPLPLEPTQTPQPIVPTRTRIVSRTPVEAQAGQLNGILGTVPNTTPCNGQEIGRAHV